FTQTTPTRLYTLSLHDALPIYGREEALRQYVLEHARPGDLDDAIRVIDKFGYEEKFMINVGDEKGELLDAALRRAAPRLILELGDRKSTRLNSSHSQISYAVFC